MNTPSRDDVRPISEAERDLKLQGFRQGSDGVWQGQHYCAAIKPNGGIVYAATRAALEIHSAQRRAS